MDLKIVCIVSYGFGVNKFISSIKIRCLALVQKKYYLLLLLLLPRVFFLGGLGVPPSGENFANPPPSDTCPRFGPRLVPPSRGLSPKI